LLWARIMVRKYSNPPLEEVFCEFRFKPSDQWDLAVPGLIYRELGPDKYPNREQVRLPVSARVSAGPEVVSYEARLVDRVKFLTQDRRTIVQLGSDLLSVHRLKPYESWECFKPIIKEAFDAYLKPLMPEGLIGLRLRYIDRFEIQGGIQNLRRYLNFGLFAGEELCKSEQFSAFIVGVQSSHEEDRDILRMELVTTSSDKGESLGLGLDTQYILNRPHEVGLHIHKIMQWLDVAHDNVNRAFEACLTDELRDAFGEVKE